MSARIVRYLLIALFAVIFVVLSIVYDRSFVIDEADWNGIIELPDGVTQQMVKVKAGSFEMRAGSSKDTSLVYMFL